MESLLKPFILCLVAIFSLIGIRWLWFRKISAKYHYTQLNKRAKIHGIKTVVDAYKVLDNVQTVLLLYERRD